jgi:hypothetical protein
VKDGADFSALRGLFFVRLRMYCIITRGLEGWFSVQNGLFETYLLEIGSPNLLLNPEFTRNLVLSPGNNHLSVR